MRKFSFVGSRAGLVCQINLVISISFAIFEADYA
jgi:hypothetical protein